jgi:hypothetical protein
MLKPIEARSLNGIKGIRHGFFTREGGVSDGLHASLNCGIGAKDDRAAVAENRARVARHLGVAPSHLLTAYQKHSAKALVVDAPWPIERETMPQVDAMVTMQRGIALGILTADCAPVLLVDEAAGVIGAAHAGWKGALDGVLEAVVDAMRGLGARHERISAAIGPCISAEAYEVGPEFEARFLEHYPGNYQYFSRPSKGSRPHFDLTYYVVTRLRICRIASVEVMRPCTYANEKHFYSYRRATHRREPDYGRQISAIVLT